MTKSSKNLIWIDLEMTGLDLEKDRILEIATIVTDPHLKILAQGPVIAIHQPDDILKDMGPWCTKQHTKSGLVKRVQESDYGEARAEAETLAFLKDYVPAGKSPMCGNSICMDRRFFIVICPN